MKFGKHIAAQESLHPSTPFVNYKGLKKIIGGLTAQDGGLTLTASPPDISRASPASRDLLESQFAASEVGWSTENKEVRKRFFWGVEREVEKINAFYLQKEAELKTRLKSLVDKKRKLEEKEAGRNVAGSYIALRDGFLAFRDDLSKLQNFVELNATGFRKILKKWDKRSKSATKEIFLSRQIEIQPCFNRQALAELSDVAGQSLSDLERVVGDHDVSRGIEELQEVFSDEVKAQEQVASLLKFNDAAGLEGYLSSQSSDADTTSLPHVFLRYCATTSKECLAVLLKSDAMNLNYIDDVSYRTALHELCISGRADILELCLSHSSLPSVSSPDNYGRTALHYAAMNDHVECILALIRHGAEVNALDHDRCTPLVLAIIAGHAKSVRLLLQEGGARIEPSTATAPIPLSLACQYGHYEITELLLHAGAQMSSNVEGLSPLHVTSRAGHADLARLLIEHGANVEERDIFNGWTPLFYACSEGHTECVRVLVDAGAKRDVRDENGWTPWCFAVYRGCWSVEDVVRVDEDDGTPGTHIDSMQTDQMPDLLLDDLPTLSLPPPMLPFRMYGHSYLENKHSVEIVLPKNPVALFPSSLSTPDLSSLRVVLSQPSGAEYTISLPTPTSDTYRFLAANLESFRVDVSVYPVFGSRCLGKGVLFGGAIETVVQSWHGGGELGYVDVPIFGRDNEQRGSISCVGRIKLGVEAVSPLVRKNKSTTLSHPPTPTTLSSTYLEAKVYLTSDRIPVVHSSSSVAITEVIRIPIWNLTFAQLQLLHPTPPASTFSNLSPELLSKQLSVDIIPLHILLTQLPISTPLALHLPYPSTPNSPSTPTYTIPQYVDSVLDTIHSANSEDGERGLVFVSFSPGVCKALSWKQGGWGVFFGSSCGRDAKLQDAAAARNTDDEASGRQGDERCASIKGAVKFAKGNNLLGVLCEATALSNLPPLIKTIKDSGLILATYGEAPALLADPTVIGRLRRGGVDVVVEGGVWRGGV
ncbi:hypothetical protein BC832DRAFT_561550 [Gaertneriomyces semiglobifer]|nr:hypothetical protein BC832DRAFT_561550 [Gaertneriomyces semiglobifer]